jgi:hypothetical protein
VSIKKENIVSINKMTVFGAIIYASIAFMILLRIHLSFSLRGFDMIDKLFENEYIAFLVVSTVITTMMLLLKLCFKFRVLLWKSTLISYIIFFILTLWSIAYEGSFPILCIIILAPGTIIQAMFFGGGPCLSGNHVLFNIFTFAFLFYAIVIWGIMIFIKKSKELVATEKKQDDNVEKQTTTETNLKDQ